MYYKLTVGIYVKSSWHNWLRTVKSGVAPLNIGLATAYQAVVETATSTVQATW